MTAATETIRAAAVLPAKPKAVYDAWLDPEKHAAMTASPATGEARVGGRFTAWDGYIEGTHLELRPPRCIVQAWRTGDFPAGAPDSRVIVFFDAEAGGTRVTIVHTDVPAGQGAEYETGWKEFYLQPMRRYFAKAAKARKR